MHWFLSVLIKTIAEVVKVRDLQQHLTMMASGSTLRGPVLDWIDSLRWKRGSRVVAYEREMDHDFCRM